MTGQRTAVLLLVIAVGAIVPQPGVGTGPGDVDGASYT